jgi:penicillin amidase
LRLGLLALLVASSAVTAQQAEQPAEQDVELLRDRWGIPHVFAKTDAGAMYGLGYATAEDRGFQMYLNLRTIQGRLAEVIGNQPKRNRRDTALQNDRKMRTFGYWPHAQKVAGNLDRQSRTLLAAYCAGVNAAFADRKDQLSPLFGKHGIDPEPWTPAACLVSWWHVAQFFGTDGTRDLIAWRNRDGRGGRGRGGRGRPPAGPPVKPDDAVAVVRRQDVTDEWVQRVEAFRKKHGLKHAAKPAEKVRRFSHAWVVGGTRTTTGAAVLVSDPQTPVANPSLFWEFHVAGRTFNARGIGVPGSPILLIGFNTHVAWGVTALGADQADLFRLQTDRGKRDQYWFDGKWRKMTVRTEKILVRGGKPAGIRICETHLGPVMTRFCFARPGDPEVCLRRVPLCDDKVDSVQASFAMMRARNVDEFWRALSRWRFPSMNAVFGDRHGDIGYSVAGAFPLRSRHALMGGRAAHDGTTSDHVWQGFVPQDLVPHLFRPKRGYLLSANHRPIGSFYGLYLGNSTGSLGDTVRSWRLRELLSAKKAAAKFTPRDVLAIHQDTVNPARREIVRLGLHVRDAQKVALEAAARNALEHLAAWYRNGAHSDLRQPGAELATLMRLNFRRNATPLAMVHGGGLTGLSRCLRTLAARVSSDPKAHLDDLEVEFVERTLADAWWTATERYGADPLRWNARARAQLQRQRLGFYEDLDGFRSLDREHDLTLPALFCVDGNTIQSQRAQSYTQWVSLDDVDTALSILPIGQSELPGDASRLSTYEMWARGDLHPAPLSRAAVGRIQSSRKQLRR